MNLSARWMLAVVFAAGGIAFLAWSLTLAAAWAFLQLLGLQTSFWAMMEAASTALAAATVVGAGLVAVWQLRETANSRYITVADRLFEELNSQENIEARRWVYQHLPDDPEEGLRNMTPEAQEKIKLVLNSLDRVAFLTQQGWIPDQMTLPWMSPMVVKAWKKLGPYVDYESRRREEPDYYEAACDLAHRCQAYRARRFPGEKITWIEDAL